MQHNMKAAEQALEHASEMQELHLAGRRLAEFPKIPVHCDITDLLCADISNNRLVDLPAELCVCTQLEQLCASRNVFRVIPDCIVQLQNLSFLDLSHNQLTGLSAAVCRLPLLEVLLLNDNRLSRLPNDLGNLAKLARFDASCNQLVALPDSITNLSCLRILNVRSNLLSSLPRSFEKLRLTELDLRSNQLSELTFDVPEHIVTRNGDNRSENDLDRSKNRKAPGDSLSGTLERILLADNPLTNPSACVSARGVRHTFKLLAKLNTNRRRDGDLTKTDQNETETETETDTIYDEIGIGIPNRPNVTSVIANRPQLRSSITSTASASGAVYQNGDSQSNGPTTTIYANERRAVARTPNRATRLPGASASESSAQPESAGSNSVTPQEGGNVARPPSNVTNGSQLDSAGRATATVPGVLSRFYNSLSSADRDASGNDADFDADVESVDSHVPKNRREQVAASEVSEEDDAAQIGTMRRTLENALKIRLPPSTPAVGELLSDGVVLCHFLNSVKPRTVLTISVPSPAQPRLSPAKARRNVEAFLDGARRIGLADSQVCDVMDVLQLQPEAVTAGTNFNINVALARVARTVLRIQARSRPGSMLSSVLAKTASMPTRGVASTGSSSSLVSNGSVPSFHLGGDSDGESAPSSYTISPPQRGYAPLPQPPSLVNSPNPNANANTSGWMPTATTPTTPNSGLIYAQVAFNNPSANSNANTLNSSIGGNMSLNRSPVTGANEPGDGEQNPSHYASASAVTNRAVSNQSRSSTPKPFRRDATPVVSLPNFV